jgi:hypothetical protein
MTQNQPSGENAIEICENCGKRPGKSYQGKWHRETQVDFNKIRREVGWASAVLCPECIAESHQKRIKRMARNFWIFVGLAVLVLLLGLLKIGLVQGGSWHGFVAGLLGVLALIFGALFLALRKDPPEKYAETLVVDVMNKRNVAGAKALRERKKEARKNPSP